MDRSKVQLPSGHGELLTRPAFEEWASLARANAEASASWDFSMAGTDVANLRRQAREEAVAEARAFSERLDVRLDDVAGTPDLIVMTGHQPELYHPGVWVKGFLLQRLSARVGAAAIDVVVDSDGFEALELAIPCMLPELHVCRHQLANGEGERCYACTPVPDAGTIESFVRSVGEQLAALSAPSVASHFAAFAKCLLEAVPDAHDISELVTISRRRFESVAGSGYLELPLTAQCRGRAFATFAAGLALDAADFAAAYNAELAAYRERTGTRSAARPAPDLRIEGDRVELPLWSVTDGGRFAVWAEPGPAGVRLSVEDGSSVDLGGQDSAAERILAGGVRVVPKALALTLFERLFVTDLFIHGVGGAGYEQVNDGIIRRYFGIEPPSFAIASLTMYLPIGAHVVSDEEIDVVVQRVNRLSQNPDQMLSEIEISDPADRERARALASEKSDLVVRIAAPGADKKTLGARIREVNVELAAILEPLRSELEEELETLRRLRRGTEVITDRTYPFCLWSPLDVADKAR